MLRAGAGRTELTPFPGVELTGWGYYIERVWRHVVDPLYATAIAFESSSDAAILIGLDLMLIDTAFTQHVRKQIQQQIGVAGEAVLITCSHSHNAPAAGGLRGVGACNPAYEEWAAARAVEAAVTAWKNRVPATLSTGSRTVAGLTYNRTREAGMVDDLLTAAKVCRLDGHPLALIVNYAAHPTVMTELHPWGVSRDVPGEICDLLESQLPGAVAMYIQGACGDTNFHRHFQTEERCHEPAETLAAAAADILCGAKASECSAVIACSQMVKLPTRRWTADEIHHDRMEAVRRLQEDDYSGWRETIGRSMTNRPDDMVQRHGGDELRAVRAMCRFHLEWTEQMLVDYLTREETLETEIQALRIGDLSIVANSSEFFSPFARDVRQRSAEPHLMMACYSNGRIGYLPDAHDIAVKSYAGLQSPKYCNQFPFTPASGPAMCDSMVDLLQRCRR